MLRSLSGRLALLLFCALSAIVAAYGVLTYRGTRMQLDEANQKLNQNLARYLVETNKLAKGDPVNRHALSKLFANLMSVNPNIEIYLLNPDGLILAYSAAEQRVKRKAVDLGPILKFLGGRPTFPLLGDDPRDPARQKVFSVAPLPAQGKPEAYLYIVLSGEEYDSVADMLLQRRLVRTTLQISALAATFLVAAWGLLFWSVTRRLRRLNERLAEFRESEPGSSVTAASAAGDEIHQLDRTFALMSQRISQQVDELKQTDQLRRELIANVSHDLRTPMTALHGYIETLLIKGHQLSSDQQREYLETAARSSQRLNRLVSELFELAKLEARREPPRLEAFSASDLLQDVAAEFQIVAEQHRVTLEMRIDEDLPSVMGDIELVERALQNLVQNAIQHTPAEGEVIIEARRETAGVRLSVRDTGSGMPDEDLPHIFDRFHKGRGAIDGTQGAGIGLAIVKRIVELHDTSIHVRSEVNVGTEFAFSLHANGSTPVPESNSTSSTPSAT